MRAASLCILTSSTVMLILRPEWKLFLIYVFTELIWVWIINWMQLPMPIQLRRWRIQSSVVWVTFKKSPFTEILIKLLNWCHTKITLIRRKLKKSNTNLLQLLSIEWRLGESLLQIAINCSFNWKSERNSRQNGDHIIFNKVQIKNTTINFN